MYKLVVKITITLYRSIDNEIVDDNNNLFLNKLNINYEYVDMVLLIIYIDINE